MQDWMDTQTERWEELPSPKVYNSLKCKSNIFKFIIIKWNKLILYL